MTIFIKQILSTILNHFSVDNYSCELVIENSFKSQDNSFKPRGKT
jgi:hypothetical protein